MTHKCLTVGAMLLSSLTFPIAAAANSTCSITLGVSASPPLATLQLGVEYSKVNGSFIGKGATVDCQASAGDIALTAYDSCDDEDVACASGADRSLSLAVLGAAKGFQGPRTFAVCRFGSASPPNALDFSITESAAALLDDTVLIPPPVVDIVSIECE